MPKRRKNMKLARKILVSVLVFTLLASCLALITSADTPELSTSEIEDVLTYYSNATYLIEDYESERLNRSGTFTQYANLKNSALMQTYAIDGYSSYASLKPYGASYSRVEEGGNSVLRIVANTPDKDRTGNYIFSSFDNDEFVMSMRFKMGGRIGTEEYEYQGIDITLAMDLINTAADDYKSGGIGFFTVSGSGGKANYGKISYLTYDTDSGFFNYNSEDSETIDGLTLADDNWYKIDFVCNLKDGYYDLAVTDEVTSAKYSAGRVALPDYFKIDAIKLTYQDPKDTSATAKNSLAYFDDIIAYHGSEIRDVVNANNAIGGYLRGLDALSKSSAVSIDDKIRIAEVYKILFFGANPYVPQSTIDEYDKVVEIVNGAEAFVNYAYADKYLYYADNISGLTGYHERLANVNNGEEFDIFSDTIDDLLLQAGFAASESDYAARIMNAKALIKAENAELATVKMHSEAFVDLILGYDDDNSDYVYLKEQVSALELFEKKDLTYKYAEMNELPATDPYQTVADAVTVYDALVAKKNEIESNVAAFETAMNNLPALESVVVTRGFANILTNYNAAKTVYVNGEFCEGIDYTTYAEHIGKLAEITALIDKFAAYTEYVNTRTAITEEFLNLVNSAARSTYYVKMFNETEQAGAYISVSGNTYSVTDKVAEIEYAGYNEAVETYNALLVKLAGFRADAALYVAAVNNIQIDAAYTSLKTAVNAAKALKEKGSVMGVTGVAEADMKFAEAEAKLTFIEGSSATLVAAVKELKETTDFARRRALISIAVNAKSGADDTIDGVSGAKTELTAQIEAYDAEIKAVNDTFAAVNKNTSDVVFTSGFNVIEIIKALFN